MTAIEFLDAGRAKLFEAYLKSGSGRAFARRHPDDQVCFLCSTGFDEPCSRERRHTGAPASSHYVGKPAILIVLRSCQMWRR